MQRIVVFGASGSGKTRLGRWLGKRLDLPFTDLDDVYWRPGWAESPVDEFRAAVDESTVGDRWVIAGNYGKARDLLWPRADTLVWLDLPLMQVLCRTTLRACRQSWTGEAICNGNRQTVAALVRPPNSLLGYTLRTYHARRREWPQLLSRPEHAHAVVVHLRSTVEVAEWQNGVQPGNTPVDK
jgi:Shikimate kinase